MKFPSVLVWLIGYPVLLPAQPDSLSLLRKVSDLLGSKQVSVSGILTDPQYLSLHPLTPFRELVKEHSQTDILTITPEAEPGKKIRVLGTVTDSKGDPVNGALVYLYQTDARGWYAAGSPHVGGNEGDMRHARLFGYVRTGPEGRFELHTVKPSGYPRSELPAHIHVHVWAKGYQPFVNEFLFDDDERLTGEIREQSVRNRFLIRAPEKATPPFEQQFSYRIRLVSE